MAEYMVIFKPSSLGLSIRTGFCTGQRPSPHRCLTPGVQNNSKGIKTIHHPPYSPDITPEDLFLFLRLKLQLAGFVLSQERLKTSWDGVIQPLSKTSLLSPFDVGYSSTKSASALAETRSTK
jgi:hypothetical protein